MLTHKKKTILTCLPIYCEYFKAFKISNSLRKIHNQIKNLLNIQGKILAFLVYKNAFFFLGPRNFFSLVLFSESRG